MFAVGRHCTKVKLGEIFGLFYYLPRLFSNKRKLHLSVGLKGKHDVLSMKYFRREYSSVDTNTVIENGDEEINFDSITNGDKNMAHKLKLLVLETEVLRQDGKAILPSSSFTDKHWRELLNISTRSARRRYLEFLFNLSKKKNNKQAKKMEKKLLRDGNNLFLRLSFSTINQVNNNRLIQAMMFGQKLVVDCGYDANMTKQENMNCVKQLMLLFGNNRAHDDPFDLHYCNANKEELLMKALNKSIPSLYEPSFPLNVHQCSYLDLFPKDQLIYLTPHCREEISEFDHDAIYIVGAIVDKVNPVPFSLTKAKKEGLKMAKLPLDTYLQWGAGSDNILSLNQVTSILNDIKITGNWEYALRHVPRSRILDFNIGSNVNKVADKLRYDRRTRERKWVPSSNLGIGNLKYNNNRDKEEDKDRLVKVKSIMYD